MMKAMWAKLFQAPSNDPRLSSLTPRELAEELSLSMAFTKFLAQASEEDEKREEQPKVRTDPEAQHIADTPILTGDPEYDKWELEETGTKLPANFVLGAHGRAATHDDP